MQNKHYLHYILSFIFYDTKGYNGNHSTLLTRSASSLDTMMELNGFFEITPAMVSAQKGDALLLTELIKSGANLTLKDSNRWSLLHYVPSVRPSTLLELFYRN